MLAWVFLHLIFLFAAVAVATGTEIIMQRVVRSGDVRVIRTIFSMAKPLGIAVPVLFSIGGIFGIIAAIEIGFGLADPWLIISYVLFAIAMVVGGAVQGPWSEKVAKAAQVSPDDSPSPELQRLLRGKKPNMQRGSLTSRFWSSSTSWWSNPSATERISSSFHSWPFGIIPKTNLNSEELP